MTFADYLAEKRIDAEAFRKAEPVRWQEWESLFEQISPASFTAQKLYLINPTRRKYLLTPAPAKAAAATRPAFKPKIR